MKCTETRPNICTPVCNHILWIPKDKSCQWINKSLLVMFLTKRFYVQYLNEKYIDQYSIYNIFLA